MADAILYSSMDQGGPSRQLQETSTENGVHGFYKLLVPCLVTGYGTGESAKPGQGWELVHADLPHGFTLKSPDGLFYVFCRGLSQTYSYAGAMTVWMAEKLTAPYSYPPAGENVRSGDHSANSSASTFRHWVSSLYYGFRLHAWYVFARGSQVVIHMDWSQSADGTAGGMSPHGDAMTTETGSYGMTMLIGGCPMKDPSVPVSGPQNAMILGGYSSKTQPATWNPSSESYGNCLYRGFTRLRNPISGVIEKGSLPLVYGLPSKYANDSSFKRSMDIYPADIMLQRVDLWEDGLGSIGYVPGMFYMPRLSHCRFDFFAPFIGKGANYGDTVLPYEIEEEPFYFLPSQFGVIVMSTLEKYW